MRKPTQLNGRHEWQNTPRQQHRFYSVYGGVSVCKQDVPTVV